jgi:hypothetical protein
MKADVEQKATKRMKILRSVALALMAGAACVGSRGVEVGEEISVGDKKVVVTKVEALPFVESQYSKRFKFDLAENPKLKELREKYGLDEVVAPGKDEFAKQVLLNDWVHRRFKKFGQPSTKARGALEVLQGIDDGQTFFCAQYAETMASAAASLGWVDRLLALRRHQGVNAHGGSTEHTTTEIWSNEYGKWVMLDPTSNMYLEAAGIPLNAWEIRQEWFYRGGTNLIFVVGKERARYRKTDLPIFLERFKDFGDLTIDPDELDKYGFIGYIPNTNLMDAGNDYGGMFIVKDALCDGTKWHIRDLPKNPAVDPYFPIDQAPIELRGDGDTLRVELKTMTPNFKTFEVKFGNGDWKASGGVIEWRPRAGVSELRARAVNAFGVKGPVSLVTVEAK